MRWRAPIFPCSSSPRTRRPHEHRTHVCTRTASHTACSQTMTKVLDMTDEVKMNGLLNKVIAAGGAGSTNLPSPAQQKHHRPL